MNVTERIEKLRTLMKSKNIDAYVIPSSDNHQSEYVGEYFMARKFISGFTGSAGTAVIAKDEAGLWTDGRYFIQAEKQLEGSGIDLYRMGQPDVPTIQEYLVNYLPENGKLAFNGQVISTTQGNNWKKALAAKNVTVEYDMDLIDEIWEDRPAMAEEPVFILEEKYSGESTASKLARIRDVMKEKNANIHVLASLDDIAWLINMRGNDVAYSPLILAYAIIYEDRMQLFISEKKLSDEAKALLAKDNIEILPYNAIYETVKGFSKEDCVLFDPDRVNYALSSNIPEDTATVEATNPEILFKALKNEVELENIRRAHIKDGVAVTKYMHWVKTHVASEKITESSAAEKLDEFRKEQDGYLWQSFSPICAYKEHAAMMHYSSTPETDVQLQPAHFFLNDTGGNYYEGSTDITRTFVLGPISDELKRDFTAVARGMIGLSMAKFLYGCTGINLDIYARQPMWEMGIDYRCGTGHGVGYLLNIHEGPAGFRSQGRAGESEKLTEGMVLTNEPGIYTEGSHGIRTENEMVVRKGEKNEYGQFMYFETITFAPIDLDGINPDLMSPREKEWLNSYHAEVYEKLSPYMTEEENEWLRQYTRAI